MEINRMRFLLAFRFLVYRFIDIFCWTPNLSISFGCFGDARITRADDRVLVYQKLQATCSSVYYYNQKDNYNSTQYYFFRSWIIPIAVVRNHNHLHISYLWLLQINQAPAKNEAQNSYKLSKIILIFSKNHF